MLISGTYDLIPQPSWGYVNTDEIRIDCDTSLAPVVINLPAISELLTPSNIKLVKLFITDASANASTNNITINADGTDTIIGENPLIIDIDGGAVNIQVSNEGAWIEYGDIPPSPAPDVVIVKSDAVVVSAAVESLDFAEDLEAVVLTANNLQVKSKDSGWIDLEGFDHIPVTYTRKPQFRKIGKQILFRGDAIVPLSMTNSLTNTLVAMTDSGLGAFYTNDASAFVYRDTPGGCLLNSTGVLTYNNNLSIFPAPYNTLVLDNVALDKSTIATRVVATSDANTGAILSGVFSLVLSTTGRLSVSTLKDAEESPYIPNDLGGYSGEGSGVLRMITSVVDAGQFVVDFRNAGAGSKNQSNDVATDFTRTFNLPSLTNTYLFSADYANESDLGGLFISLDGLRAFID